MRCWCLRGSNLTAEKCGPTARDAHRIVKFTNTRLLELGLRKPWKKPGWEARGYLQGWENSVSYFEKQTSFFLYSRRAGRVSRMQGTRQEES